MTTDNRTVLDVELPEGFEIHRVPSDFGVAFEIHEGRRWEDGSPRASTQVDLYQDRGKTRATDEWEPTRVGWPSPSDKRPVLARVFAVALSLAADEADKLDEEGRKG